MYACGRGAVSPWIQNVKCFCVLFLHIVPFIGNMARLLIQRCAFYSVLIGVIDGVAPENESISCQAVPTSQAAARARDVLCYSPSSKDADGSFAVTIYYVRHGESEWNERSHSSSEKALNKQFELTDAKLTRLGAREAQELSSFIQRKAEEIKEVENSKREKEGIEWRTTRGDDWKILNGERVTFVHEYGELYTRKAAYATSNLRRASLTFLLAFKHLMTPFSSKIDKLHILSALQEPVDNIDSNSLARPRNPPALSYESCPIKARSLMDSTCNRGDEMEKNNRRTGDQLLANFCRWMRNMAAFGHVPARREQLFPSITGGPRVTDFIIAGHSMFLRGLFQRYLTGGGPGVHRNKLEKYLSSEFYTVGNGSLIKIKFILNNPITPISSGRRRLRSDVESCQIEKGSTEILAGAVYGRNVLRDYLDVILPDND